MSTGFAARFPLLLAALRDVFFKKRGGRRLIVLLAGLLLIIGWQSRIRTPDPGPEGVYHVYASTGVHSEWKFFFYLYHLGVYPLATDAEIREDTKAEAERLLRAEPQQLKQDEGVTFRSGDRGRVYLYYVDGWLTKRSTIPSLVPAHRLAFGVALCALWVAFWWIARPGLGALLVLFLGSNPFQLYSIFNEENVFSWGITAMIVLLALHAPLMVRVRSERFQKYYPWVAAITTAVFMTLVRTVRSEPMPILLGPVLVYVTLSNTRWWKRIALVVVLTATFMLGNFAAVKFFQHKFHKAQKTMIAVGAEPYTGPLQVYHEFWHVLFCGLGDFDTKYGYEWNDLKAYELVYPHYKEWHPELKINPNSAPQDFYYDKGKKYPVYFGEIDERYHDIVKKKILTDIKNDPKWFATIIYKRIKRVLTETTPISAGWGFDSIQMKGPVFGTLAIPLLIYLLFRKRFFYAKLLAFSSPLAIPAIAAYSDRGMAYYSCVHIFAAAIIAMMLADGFRVWQRQAGD